MVKVVLWGSLKGLAGGAAAVEVEAKNVRQLLDAVCAKHPGLRERVEEGVALSIDGQIHQDDWFQPVEDSSEVYLLPYMEGG